MHMSTESSLKKGSLIMTDIVIICPLFVEWRSGRKMKKFILNMNNYRNRHHNDLSKAKKRYSQELSKQIFKLDPIKNGPYIFKFDYYHGNRRLFDVANPVSIIDKFATDALVNAGVIDDDNINFISKVEYQYCGIDKDNPRCELRIVKAPTNT